jgi:hypothetical protein
MLSQALEDVLCRGRLLEKVCMAPLARGAFDDGARWKIGEALPKAHCVRVT